MPSSTLCVVLGHGQTDRKRTQERPGRHSHGGPWERVWTGSPGKSKIERGTRLESRLAFLRPRASKIIVAQNISIVESSRRPCRAARVEILGRECPDPIRRVEGR